MTKELASDAFLKMHWMQSPIVVHSVPVSRLSSLHTSRHYEQIGHTKALAACPGLRIPIMLSLISL